MYKHLNNRHDVFLKYNEKSNIVSPTTQEWFQLMDKKWRYEMVSLKKKEVSVLNKLKIHSEQSGRSEMQQVWSNREGLKEKVVLTGWPPLHL